jgi:phosphohistidine phosphatase SixA
MDDIAPGGDAARLINEIQQKYADVQNIALVGHEPGLSRLISTLMSGDPTLAITMKKGGVCCLSIETLSYGRCATLEWLMGPAELASIYG